MLSSSDRKESRPHNSSYPKGAVSCSKDSFVVNGSLVFQIKFCSKGPTLRVAANRCGAFKMKRLKNILAFLFILLLLTSCEGFKVLTIHNTSVYEAKVTVRPGLDYSDKRQMHNYPNNQASDSSIVVLKPDSSMTILSIFTGMMFNAKIKERELRTDYLKIETENDTIIAESRSEILVLLKDKKTKYRRESDKDKVIANGKNWGNIFIRK